MFVKHSLPPLCRYLIIIAIVCAVPCTMCATTVNYLMPAKCLPNQYLTTATDDRRHMPAYATGQRQNHRSLVFSAPPPSPLDRHREVDATIDHNHSHLRCRNSSTHVIQVSSSSSPQNGDGHFGNGQKFDDNNHINVPYPDGQRNMMLKRPKFIANVGRFVSGVRDMARLLMDSYKWYMPEVNFGVCLLKFASLHSPTVQRFVSPFAVENLSKLLGNSVRRITHYVRRVRVNRNRKTRNEQQRIGMKVQELSAIDWNYHKQRLYEQKLQQEFTSSIPYEYPVRVPTKSDNGDILPANLPQPVWRGRQLPYLPPPLPANFGHDNAQNNVGTAGIMSDNDDNDDDDDDDGDGDDQSSDDVFGKLFLGIFGIGKGVDGVKSLSAFKCTQIYAFSLLMRTIETLIGT